MSPEENSVTSAADERRFRNVSNFLIIVVLLLFVCLMKVTQMTNLELGTSVFPFFPLLSEGKPFRVSGCVHTTA